MRRETVPPSPPKLQAFVTQPGPQRALNFFISCSYSVSTVYLQSPMPSLCVCATQWHMNATRLRSRDHVGCGCGDVDD